MGPVRRVGRRLSLGILGVGMSTVAWIIERKLLKQIKAGGSKSPGDREATVSPEGDRA